MINDYVRETLMPKLAEGADMKDIVRDYLEYLAMDNEDFAEKYENKDKSIDRCWDFIVDQAREYSATHGVKTNGGVGVYVPEIMIFGWATHYYEESDLDIDRKKEQPKPSASRPAAIPDQLKAKNEEKAAAPQFKIVKDNTPKKPLSDRQLRRGEDCGFLF